MAARVVSEAGSDLAAQLVRAYGLVHLWRPSKGERAAGLCFLSDQTAGYTSDGAGQEPPANASPDGPLGSEAMRRQSLVDFCLVLLNSAAFLYVN